MMKDESVFIYSPQLLKYKFNQHHPFNQITLKTYTRLTKKALGLFMRTRLFPLACATNEELHLSMIQIIFMPYH